MEPRITFECYSPDMKQYLLDHNYPAILEALITGLTVMMPYNPWEFVKGKLEELQANKESAVIQWDMFVEEDMKPRLHFLRRGMLDSLLDDTDLPAEELLIAAFQFRRKKLLGICFKAWTEFHLEAKEAMAAYTNRLKTAKQTYATKMTKIIFTKWRNYTIAKSASVQVGYLKMFQVGNFYLKKITFHAWLEDYKETRQAKRWFNLSKGGAKGGEEDGEENGEWHWPEGEDPISVLPIEVSSKIFSLVGIRGLCRCAQVCRSWKEISENQELWNKVDFSIYKNFVCDGVVMRLFHKYRPLLGHLNLQGCSRLTPDSLRHIGQCQNLQDLNLSECNKLNEEAMQLIAKGCSGLLYLNLSYCNVTDSIIRILTKYCVSLHYLSLAYSTQFTSKGLQSITTGKGCRRVVHLNLSGCTHLSSEGMHFIGRGCPILNELVMDDIPECTDSMIIKLVAHCHTLRHISFMGGGSLVTDKAFKYLAMENRKLRTVKIENNTSLTDVSLRAFAKACRDLSHLYLAGCSRITDQGLRALASLRKLQVLNLADCTRVSDAGIRHVIENAPGSVLRELNLTNIIKISDVTLLRMSQSCKALTYVCFCYCEHISDTGVELLGHMPWLTSLDLSGCNITDQGVAGLRFNPQFRHLALAELMDVTDDGLQKMCSTLSRLESLDLSDCENITNSGLQTIAYKCHLLKTLYIANCHRIDDEGIRFLTQGCSYLLRLDMSGCSVSDRALRHLRRGCVNLTRLDVLSCVNVTRDAVQKYQSKGVQVTYNTDRPKYLQHPIQDIHTLPVEPLLDRI